MDFMEINFAVINNAVNKLTAKKDYSPIVT